MAIFAFTTCLVKHTENNKLHLCIFIFAILGGRLVRQPKVGEPTENGRTHTTLVLTVSKVLNYMNLSDIISKNTHRRILEYDCTSASPPAASTAEFRSGGPTEVEQKK